MEPPELPAYRQKVRPWLWVLLLGGVLAFGALNFAPDSREVKEREPVFGSQEKGDAWLACRREMKNRLKAPSTAKFPDDPMSWAMKAEEKVAWVEGFVDAQNPFGATLRSRFACKFGWSGSGWTLLSLASQ